MTKTERAALEKLSGVALPIGYTTEVIHGNYLMIYSPCRFMVTLDPGNGGRRRGFRSGMVVCGRLTSGDDYSGRAWHERLVRDAVEHLQDLERTK